MDRIHQKVFSVVVLVLTSTTALLSAESNPLLGRWKFSGKGFVDSQGHDWCDTAGEVRFDATRQIVTTAATPNSPATQKTSPAYYSVYGTKIYVSSTSEIIDGPYYTMIDHDHMLDENAIGRCVYQRE